MAWKILITDGLEKVGKDLLDAHDEGVDKKGIEADELLQVIPEYDAVIVRGRTKVTADVLNAGTKLKAVGRMGVGVDNIDLEAAKARGDYGCECTRVNFPGCGGTRPRHALLPRARTPPRRRHHES